MLTMNRSAFLRCCKIKSLTKYSVDKRGPVGRHFATEVYPDLQAERQREEALNRQRESLVVEAGAMTRSLFRICLRSIKLMRQGNEHDELRFREMEEQQLKLMEKGIFSASPPVHRENELHSRADYYTDVARERIYRSSQCMDLNPLTDEDLHEYIYHLRRGEKHRQWVLSEYKFTDPCPYAFDHERADAFEQRFKKYLLDVGFGEEDDGEALDFKGTYNEDDDSGEEEELDDPSPPGRGF